VNNKPFALLAWDTEHFGFTTAKLSPGCDLPSALHLLREDGVTLAYLFVNEGDHDLFQKARSLGGQHVDEKRTFAGSLAKIADGSVSEIYTYASHELHDDLRDLAIESGLYSRFRVDPRFPRDRFESLYTQWIKSSIEGRIAKAVLVATEKDHLVGMVTVGVKEGRADIGLIAVANTARGRGLGGQLVRAAAQWGLSYGLTDGQVVTQGANQEACRLYLRCGYHQEKVEHVFHFWIQ
jgi:dTDP-4-amino-4,6-dideoxy-D-galactose acyltransferase